MSIVWTLSERAPQRLVQPQPVSTQEAETERRQDPRHQCQLDATVQPITGHGGQWPARAVDISATGVSLLLSRRFEPATLLSIQLRDGDCMPLARVCRVAPHGVYWRIGCVWVDPLSADELCRLFN